MPVSPTPVRTGRPYRSHRGVLAAIAAAYLGTVGLQAQSFDVDTKRTVRSSSSFGVSNDGSIFSDVHGVPWTYPRGGTGHLSLMAGFSFSTVVPGTDARVVVRSAGTSTGSSDFVPGRLGDGDRYRVDLEPMYDVTYADYGSVERMTVQCHDGDVDSYASYDAESATSAGLPLRTDVTMTVDAHGKGPCDGCIAIRLRVDNRSERSYAPFGITFTNDPDIGPMTNPFLASMEDRARIVTAGSYRALLLQDASKDSARWPAYAIALVRASRTDGSHSFVTRSFASPDILGYGNNGYEMLMAGRDSLEPGANDLVAFSSYVLPNFTPGSTVTLDIGLVPLDASTTDAEKLAQLGTRLSYLSSVTSVDDVPERAVAAIAGPVLVTDVLVLPEMEHGTVLVTDVTGQRLPLAVDAYRLSLGHLPAGLYTITSPDSTLRRLVMRH